MLWSPSSLTTATCSAYCGSTRLSKDGRYRGKQTCRLCYYRLTQVWTLRGSLALACLRPRQGQKSDASAC